MSFRTKTFGVRKNRFCKRVQVQGVALGGNVAESTRHQARTDVADTGANLQNVVAQVRANGVRQPTHVLGRSGKVIEESPAVLADIQIVDQPKVQNDTTAL